MADKTLLLRAFLRGAKLRADELGETTPKAILESVILGKFKLEATNGRTVVSVGEAGGSTSFMIPQMLGPADVMALAEEAIEFLESLPDPENPNLSFRRIRRFRVSFSKATL